MKTFFTQLSIRQTGLPVCLAERQIKVVCILRSCQTDPAYCLPSMIASVRSLHKYYRTTSGGGVYGPLAQCS